MRSWRAMCETINLTVTGVWLGVLVMTGVAAAVLFPMVRDLRPTLPDYSLYQGEHWRIAAGKPADRMFIICDAIQFVCAMIAAISLATLVFAGRVRVRRAAMLVRIAMLVVAFALLGARFFFLQPWMDTNLRAFWEAAEKGDNASAERFRAAFDADHPIASNMLAATLLCVLVTMVLGAWCAATHDRAAVEGGTGRGRRGEPAMETPMLARTPGR